MAKRTHSAKGVVIDFDLLSITASLANQPTPVNVDKRRKFIDEKEKSKVIRAVPAAQYKGPDLPTTEKDVTPTTTKTGKKTQEKQDAETTS